MDGQSNVWNGEVNSVSQVPAKDPDPSAQLLIPLGKSLSVYRKTLASFHA